MKTKDKEEDFFPTRPTSNRKENQAVYMLVFYKEISTAYQDLMGRYPVQSSRRNEYVLIGYHHNANCIMGYLWYARGKLIKIVGILK